MLTEENMVAAQQLIVNEANAHGAGAIPWQAIIDMLMTLLHGCIKPPANGAEAKAQAAGGGLLVRFQARRAAREVLGDQAGFRTVQAAVDAGLSAVAKAEPALLDAFIVNA